MKKIFCFSLLIGIAYCYDASNILGGKRDGIVGGDFISIEDAPYMAQILHDGEQQCGAAIISNEWILTAAHCIDPEVVMTVTTGSFLIEKGVEREVEKYIVHRNYDEDTTENDIALIKAKTPIKYSKKQQPIEISNAIPQTGDELIITGWGRVGQKLPSSTRLKSAVVKVSDQKECIDKYGEEEVMVNKNMFCAYEKRIDSCQGDSGGPAVINGKIAGVVSFGIGCADGYPGVYTRVHNYRKWISKNTGLKI